MKTYLLIAACLGFMSCAPSPTTADGTATAFLTALQNGNFSDALALVDTETKPQLLSVETISRGLSRDQWSLVSGIQPGSIAILKIDTTKKPATVDYSIANGPPETLQISRDGQTWKVHYQARSIFP